MEARFTDIVTFIQAEYFQRVRFNQAFFEGYTTLSQTTFHGEADFTAILVDRAFTLAGARFQTAVPDFTQSHFREAPQLDNITLPSPDDLKASKTTPDDKPVEWDQNTEVYYRALKRLAISGP